MNLVATTDYTHYLRFCRENRLNTKETVYVRTLHHIQGREGGKLFILPDCECPEELKQYAEAHGMDWVLA